MRISSTVWVKIKVSRPSMLMLAVGIGVSTPVYANPPSCNFLQRLLGICPVVQETKTQIPPTAPSETVAPPPPVAKSSSGRIRVIRKPKVEVYELKSIDDSNDGDDLFSQIANIKHDTIIFTPVESGKKPTKGRIKVIRPKTVPIKPAVISKVQPPNPSNENTGKKLIKVVR